MNQTKASLLYSPFLSVVDAIRRPRTGLPVGGCEESHDQTRGETSLAPRCGLSARNLSDITVLQPGPPLFESHPQNPCSNCTAATKETLPRIQIFAFSNRVTSGKMLRTAVLRSATAAAAAPSILRPSVRRLAARLSILSYTPRSSMHLLPRAASWVVVRSYSSGGGSLTKDDVADRIMGLLKGFDKVRGSLRLLYVSASASFPRMS